MLINSHCGLLGDQTQANIASEWHKILHHQHYQGKRQLFISRKSALLRNVLPGMICLSLLLHLLPAPLSQLIALQPMLSAAIQPLCNLATGCYDGHIYWLESTVNSIWIQMLQKPLMFQVDAQEKKKRKTGRAKRREQYTRRFVNVVASFGRKKGPNSNS